MVSVIVTTYNVEKYIEQSIKSICNQTYKDLEIIIVEDCSTDSTPQLVDDLAKEDSRIKVIHNPENFGAGWSRRIGISQMTGEYGITIDSDDWIEYDFIESLYKNAIETDADIVSGAMKICYEDGSYTIHSNGDTVTEGYDKVAKYWGQKTVFMNNRLIKKTLFDRVPYCTRRYIEDTSTIIPMVYFANKVVYIDNPGYNYRMNPNSLTHTTDEYKDFIYKGLSYCDLMEFFIAHDKEILKVAKIKEYGEVLRLQLNNMVITSEFINKYGPLWVEFTARFFNIFKIDSLSDKEVEYDKDKVIAQ